MIRQLLSRKYGHISTPVFFAQAIFFIYFFFILFGTQMPLQKGVRDIELITTSNVFSQYLFSTLYIFAFVLLIGKIKQVKRFFITEKWLALTLLWALFSILWSNFAFVSVKRWIQEFGILLICLSFLLRIKSIHDGIKIIRLLFAIYIPVCLASVFLFPEAIDPSTLTWRGIAPSKNTLAQNAVIAILVFSANFQSKPLKLKFFYGAMVLMSFVLLVGSRSMTSLSTVLFILGLGIVGWLRKSMGSRSISGILLLVITLLAVLLLVFIGTYAPRYYVSLFDFFGKDLTFTERTFLWQSVFEQFLRHPIIGCGFQGFWVIDTANLPLMNLYEEFIWLPNQAHMGYLDILNHTGIIGFALFLIMLFRLFWRARIIRNHKPWMWLVIALVIINFQESTFFNQNILPNVLFVFSYIWIYLKLMDIKVSRAV